MSGLMGFKLTDGTTVVVEMPATKTGGAPVGIAGFYDSGKLLGNALDALPRLVNDIKTKLAEQVASAAEVKVEFGIKVGGDVGLIVAKSQTEAHFTVSVTWKS